MIHTLTVQYGHVINEMAEAEMARAVGRAPDRAEHRERNALRLVEWDFDNDAAAVAALAVMPKLPGVTYIVGDALIAPAAPAVVDEPAAAADEFAPVDFAEIGGPLPTLTIPVL